MQIVILAVLGFIFVMGLAILVHELGHFMAARKFGVLCHQFAIGMGPALWKKRKGETLYKICAIPIGGYVMMGMDEGERDIIKEGTEIGLTLDSDGHVVKIHIAPEEGQLAGTLISNTIDISADLQIAVLVAGERQVYPVSREAWYIDSAKDQTQQIVPSDRRLEQKPKLQRLIIMAAGAMMNFVLAYVLVLIIGAFLGEAVGWQLGAVNQGEPAYEAGLRAGDTLLEMDGVPVTDGNLIFSQVQASDGNELVVRFERDGVVHETVVLPNVQDDTFVIGITIDPILERSFWGTFRFANEQYRTGLMLIFDTLRMLGSGEAGVGDLAGPVGIAYVIGQVAAQGFWPLLMFASVINIQLGIFNLIPFPALDGGHMMFIGIEAIMGKPVSPKIQHGIAIVGFIALMGLMVFVTFNDVFRFVLE